MASASKWKIDCDYLESCNCDFGCACNFSGFPNYGACHALVGLHIRRGNYGDTQLDGNAQPSLRFLTAAPAAPDISRSSPVLSVMRSSLNSCPSK